MQPLAVRSHLFLKIYVTHETKRLVVLTQYDENCEISLNIIDNTKEACETKSQPDPRFKTPIIARMLYCKLRYLISDKTWKIIRKYSRDEFPSCPTLNALKTYQNQLEIIKAISIDKGAYVDVLQTISARLRLVVKDYSIPAEELLIVRISSDTCNAIKTKILAITFTVTNETNKCKAARGNYVLGLLQGKL